MERYTQPVFNDPGIRVGSVTVERCIECGSATCDGRQKMPAVTDRQRSAGTPFLMGDPPQG